MSNEKNEIENKSVFETKEDHYKFTEGWKNFLNNGNAKILRDEYGHRDSPLTCEYHLFYGIARNQKIVGFKKGSEGLLNAIDRMGVLTAKDLKKVFGYTLPEDLVARVRTALKKCPKV